MGYHFFRCETFALRCTATYAFFHGCLSAFRNRNNRAHTKSWRKNVASEQENMTERERERATNIKERNIFNKRFGKRNVK